MENEVLLIPGILEVFVTPSKVIVIAGYLAFIFFLLKRKTLALAALSAAAICYVFFGTGIIALKLLSSLENRYPPLLELNDCRDVKAIIILSGYAQTNTQLPVSSNVNFSSICRLNEGARIFRTLSRAVIVISGSGLVPAEMKNLLVSIGVPGDRVFIENNSKNTHESAVNSEAFLRTRDERFILVTSAGHMPRAFGSFKKRGLNPVAAPANHMSAIALKFEHFIPSPHSLAYSDLAVHEYVGLAWYRLTDRL